MSPRAAWRLEVFGFTEVYDYVGGKQDWMAAGLPFEGTRADLPTAGTVARADVPTCRLDERLGDVRDRVDEAGWDLCVAVNEHRVVLGLLKQQQLDGDRDALIDDAMRSPSTFRPHVGIVEMADVMTEHDMSTATVTTSDGVLVGVLRREDATRAALEVHRRHEHGDDDDEP
ncbi:MAG TPA: CBS domain-containing protein [Actinomycetota bacterium]